ncbi:MAG: hypothetical protein EBY28_05650 [Betaproteobacteria bacterium]|nr:hypothetical protein [Betaproteobacteria bacterium]
MSTLSPLQRQHVLAGAWSEGDPVGARRGLQRPEHAGLVRITVVVGHVAVSLVGLEPGATCSTGVTSFGCAASNRRSGMGSSLCLADEGRGVLLHQAVQRGLFRAVAP